MSTSEEEWREVQGYEGLYEVSNFGRVRTLNYKRTGAIRVMKDAGLKKTGHRYVVLYKNGVKMHQYVHRLVAQAFVSNPNNLPCVNHKDENPTNNCANNLEWCSKEYNNTFGSRTERIAEKKRGHNNTPKSKAILQLSLDGELLQEWPSAQEIKRQLGYSQGNISTVCLGRHGHHTAYGYIWKYKEAV